MQLSKYISDLLYRYECVIVPGFGGFVSNSISSTINHYTHTFTPPTKKLSFNSQLVNNDGLLANYIASSENISFEEAIQKIELAVANWNTLLKDNSIDLKAIGTLRLNKENKIIFAPVETTNYLASSFGLDTFQSDAIKRVEYKQKVTQLETSEKRKSPGYLKYAATVAAFLTIGALSYNSVYQKKTSSLAKEYQETVSRKIQEATFVISNPLPEINLDVVKKELPKKFHLIAGAFSEKANALKKVNQLKKKGFNAQIVGVNKWGLTQVSFESYTTRKEAKEHLKIIKKNIAKDAWLYIK
ncbi:SPOR domain-containing protein [Flavicella sp.]|uniref:HU domain-containing protein n=1 Tax=Flavicella sp. TaxID=2957742 RepID=UPI00262749E1|nr:SPOR domain-containing protein [Flavicella sp.]MDG1805131.1 SPOR domain-containing protein [Flavicella sp.]MDG2279337.1 SPOR domain-containing protein [Flavicella sp.]